MGEGNTERDRDRERGVHLRHVAEEKRKHRGRGEISVVGDRSTTAVRSSSSVTRRANDGAESMDSTTPLGARFLRETPDAKGYSCQFVHRKDVIFCQLVLLLSVLGVVLRGANREENQCFKRSYLLD